MKEIDNKLKQWIPVNTIVRAEVRQIIVKAIEKARQEGCKAGLDYKLNTNTNG